MTIAISPMKATALVIPAEAHTLDGFRTWALSGDVPEKLPLCFYDGRIFVDMGQEEILTHAAVKTAIAGTMYQLLLELDFGDFFINGVLLSNTEAQVSNNPDMLAISWESLESGKVRYIRGRKNRESEIVGSPDWALEIVSQSSVTKDKQELRRAYHQAGIREYWIVDARGEAIEFQILHWRKAGYTAVSEKDRWRTSRMFSREFRLTRKRDRRGGWRYQLDRREIT